MRVALLLFCLFIVKFAWYHRLQAAINLVRVLSTQSKYLHVQITYTMGPSVILFKVSTLSTLYDGIQTFHHLSVKVLSAFF